MIFYLIAKQYCRIAFLGGIGALILLACNSSPQPKKTLKKKTVIKKEKVKEMPQEEVPKPDFVLNEDNAIPFFFEYEKEHSENKVRIKTAFGNIDIRLYENTPYHRANFIYLTKKKYFDGTTFHRVVPGFIIQGGNSDNYKTSYKRNDIGRYLLPPDTKKGHRHHRGVISMPSSEIDNPHKLASPYEFFIVQQSPGAYHLDGSYTAFGEVIAGMDVVDTINKQAIDNRETPLHNIFMEVIVLKKSKEKLN